MQRDAAAAAQKGAAAMSVRKGMTVASSRKGTAARQKGKVQAAAMAEPQQKGGVQATGNAELVESSVTNASFLQSGTPTSMGFFPPGFQANHPAFTQGSTGAGQISPNAACWGPGVGGSSMSHPWMRTAAMDPATW